MTMCAFQLLFGKLYIHLDLKWVFVSSVFIFEVGSIICAAAPSSVVLIVGRAVAGIGGSGITSGAMIVSHRFAVTHWTFVNRVVRLLPKLCLCTNDPCSPAALAVLWVSLKWLPQLLEVRIQIPF